MQSTKPFNSQRSRRSSVSSARGLKDIPRVQIFLDSQLNKAISKIKEQSSHKKPQMTSSYRKITLEQPSEQSFKPAISGKRQSTPESSLLQNNLTIMPNDIVLNYIQEVYQKYGIKNPFEGYLDQCQFQKEKDYFAFEKYPSFSDKKEKNQVEQEADQSIKTHKKQRKISQNQARIFQLKNKFKQTIENEASIQENTIKKLQPSNIPQLSQQGSLRDVDFIKKSQGNITYIDRLTNLIQSQIHDTYDFENDSTMNKTGTNEETPERSLKHINKFYEDTSHEGMIESPQVAKPKKKLFVKTRTASINYHSSKQETPQNAKNARVTFRGFQLQPREQDSQEDNDGYKRKKDMTSIIRIQESPLLITSKQNIQNLTSSKSILYQNENHQIPQIYRYCLGCQSPILNSNISFHQNKCQQLKKISNLPLRELYQLVNNKLERLRQQIERSELMNLNTKDLTEIREYTSAVLGQKNDNESGDNKKEEFAEVGMLLTKKLLTGCELIKKLEWFTKLKDNLKECLYVEKSMESNQAAEQIAKYQTK